MNIAFDVKGTLEGPKGITIRYILHHLMLRGHKITIWSNSLAYAMDYVKDYGLLDKIQPVIKFSKSDVEYKEDLYFDVAFEDDRSQGYLAAKHIVFVDQISADREDIWKLIDSFDKIRQ